MNKFIKTNQNINEGIFGMGRSRPEDTGFDTAQTIGDVGSNVAGLASFLPGMRPKTSAILRSIAAGGNIANAYGDHLEGDTQDVMQRSAMGLGWALGALSAGKAGKIGKVASTPLLPPPTKTKLPPTELLVRPVRRTQRPQNVIITPLNPITNPNRLLPQIPSVVQTPPPIVQPKQTSALDAIDPRIHAIVSRARSRSGKAKYKKPSDLVIDRSGGGGSRLSRDLDIPELGKVGYNPMARKEMEYALSKNNYWGDVHPGYYDALSKVDPGAARAMSYLGGQKKIESLFAGYEPEVVNNVLFESMMDHLKKKNIDESWIDTVQDYADYGTAALGFVPGLNVVASGLGALSAGVDAAQGQYGDAAFRGGMAALGLVPGLGSAGTLAGKGLAGAGKFALKGAGAGLLKTGKAQRLGSSLMGYGTKLGKYKTSLAANQMRTIGAQSMLKGTAARNVAKNQFGTRALGKVGGLRGAADLLFLGSMANSLVGNPIGQAYDYLTRKSSKAPQSGDPNVHWSAQEILDRARERQASSSMGPANVSSAINQSDSSGSSEKFRNRF